MYGIEAVYPGFRGYFLHLFYGIVDKRKCPFFGHFS